MQTQQSMRSDFSVVKVAQSNAPLTGTAVQQMQFYLSANIYHRKSRINFQFTCTNTSGAAVRRLCRNDCFPV